MRFLLRRAVHASVLLVAASMMAFLLADLAPGDFVDELKVNSQMSPDTLASLRSEYGLDQALPARYWKWVRSIGMGEGGFSFAYNSAAGPLVLSRGGRTLILTGAATLLAWFAALPLGMWAAARRHGLTDWMVTGAMAILLATPELVLGLLLLLFAARTGYFPIGGLTSLDPPDAEGWRKAADIVRHTILPSLCLAAGLLPLLLSHIRTAVAEVLGSPYIAAAHALGVPKARLLARHVLPAAANPIISLFGLSLGMLISSSLLVEVVFSWPGLGQLMLEAISRRDFFVVVDAAVLSTGFLIAGNLVADVLLYVSDPRIRTT